MDMERLKKIMLYGNTDPGTFRAIGNDMLENNRINLFVATLVAVLGMGGMTVASFFEESLVHLRGAYIGCFAVSLVLLILSVLQKKRLTRLILAEVYFFIALLLLFGIVLGTVIAPDDITVSFLVLLLVVPFFFVDIPLRMDLALLIGILVYIAAARHTQNPEIFVNNMCSVIPYGLVSLIISSYTMFIKIRRHVLEYENRQLLNTDQLTGIANRRRFEQHMQQLRTNGCPAGTRICAFDLNGLKAANDNLGHHAGDELIRGAADCLEDVFGKYGTCYRTGGDEFMAILEKAAPSAEELKAQMQARCADFHGTYVSELSISCGIVAAEEGEAADELSKRADKEMYADKSRYYRQRGIDRRK